jgi:hypothetical protein
MKVKVKLSLRLTKYDTMRTYEGMEVNLPTFLTSALNGGELSSSAQEKDPIWKQWRTEKNHCSPEN